MGVVKALVIILYLAIGHLPLAQYILGNFFIFGVLASFVGVPLSIGLGFVHIKVSPAFRSGLDVATEANPLYYNHPLGHTKEAMGLFYLELLTFVKTILESQHLLTDGYGSMLKKLEKQLRLLKTHP